MIEVDEAITNRETFNSTKRPVEETVLFESKVFVRRHIRLSARCEIVCDALPEDGMEIQFVQWTASATSDPASFAFSGESTGLHSDARMGTIFTRGPDGEKPALWSPSGLVVGRSDQHGRLSIVDGYEVESWWELSGAPIYHLAIKVPEDTAFFWPIVFFGDETPTCVAELVRLRDIELQHVVKSDWFEASSVADLWKYLINGTIYDPRDAGWGNFRCQQCAFAWWSYLMALHRGTGKPHYRALAREVAWTVCVDLGDDGSWRHGYWREEPEIHARFFWDGVRLLLAEYEESGDDQLLTGAEKAARFARDHLSDVLDRKHLWWLHDSLEAEGCICLKPSILGRSAGNSLCLNTHVQALSVLNQLTRLNLGADDLAAAYESGLETLQIVLQLAGGSAAFRVMDRRLTSLLDWKVPHGFLERVLRFFAYRVFAWGIWRIRKGAPRLVFPSGYLDRDLGATMLADEYHVINLKELIGLYRVEPKSWMRPVIDHAYEFAVSLDFARALERHPIWAEWCDVVLMWKPTGAVRMDAEEVGRTVRERLGSSSLDAFCRRLGVELTGSQAGKGQSLP